MWTQLIDPGEGSSVQQTSDGGYIIAGFEGHLNSDAILTKTNSIGDALWTRTYGIVTEEKANSVQQTTDGGYILVGSERGTIFGTGDVYLIRTDANGDTLWTKTFGDAGSKESGSIVQQTTDGGFIIIGTTEGLGAGENDVYFIKTDASGNSGCNEDNPPTIVQTPPTVASKPSTQISFGGTLASTSTLVGSGSINTTLCFIGVNETENENSLVVFPNPASSSFTLIATTQLQGRQIEIYNLFGDKVLIQTIASNFKPQQTIVDVSKLCSGVYFVKVGDGNLKGLRKW